MATALVVGNMVGSGIFLLPAALGAFGGISLAGWAFSLAGATVLALVFALLARGLPRTGGPYAYARAGVGEFPAFLVAWGYWISICAGNAAIAVAGVGYLGFFWHPLATVPALSGAAALVAVWACTWINVRGARTAGGVQLATTILKLVPLVAVGTVGLAYVQWGHFVPFNPSGRSPLAAVSATAALTLWAFLGLESATVPAGDVARPARTIPLATVAGTLIAGIVYVLGTVAVLGIVPRAALVASTAPFADAATAMWGPWAAGLIAAGGAVACFGALNGWVLLQGQVPMAAADDGLLPRVFARRSPRGTPAAGLAISSVLVTVIVLLNYARGLVGAFTFIILLATVTTLVPFLLSSLALLRMSWQARGTVPATRLAARVALSAGALAFSAWAVAGTGRDAILWGCVLLLAGVPLFLRAPARPALNRTP